jgi:hypothetical protein
MARSSGDLEMFKAQIEAHGVKDGENAGELIDHSTEIKQFESQQKLLEHTVHTGDMSVATRHFDVVRNWTYLLFDEFFAEGDMEKANDLPLGFLNDRTGVKVIGMQAGFVNFAVMPIFKAMA